MATGLLIVYKKSADNGQLEAKDKLMPIFSIACYAFAGYSLYRYIKNSPKITLDKEFITFNNKTYSISDIKKVTLTGKRPFKYAINFPMEAATLTFNNNETKYIFDDMYSNSWEIKSFLKQIVIDKNDFLQVESLPTNNDELISETIDTFKGKQIISLRGLVLWVFIGAIAYMVLKSTRPVTIGLMIFVLSISLFWFFVVSYQMHYFQMSENFFLIRNHNFFWKKKVYRISDLKEIVFETQGKMPNCLRVITQDFRNKLYPAGTLRDKTWLSLKEKLEAHKIKVRNECI